ncbi:MAG: shikimate dehydrogenase [Chloroflexi bacterium]|nr:shikimate dehydrogenase [Chloroflexota bacterium]
MHLGLIGYPLGHSLSPKIHTAALAACGLQGEYSLFPIAPDDMHGLKDLLARVRNGEIRGLNVTIPHKQNVIALLDELTPTAQAIGAVNTISMREGKLTGDNTDAPGFLADLKNFLTTETRPPSGMIRHRGKKTLVLGAGGSARAVVYALVHDGWDVTLSARRPEQAQVLASNYHLPITNLTDLRLATFDLLVNSTPLGMFPNVDASPWPEHLAFPKDGAVYDLVYNPRKTKLVRNARAAGLPATTGLGMLIEQAALAFEIWTGQKPPREILFEAVNGG